MILKPSLSFSWLILLCFFTLYRKKLSYL
ncbi:MAG: hypothetical protein DRP91_05425 [Candidatus Neomarinimicrobiota bacterium]|nr:MAG: hypothetical protein DRP88_08640 [Candidatus Neomarinimicrobiota bacterium]RKY48773.1 MAG: hypothetical protein DRP91_05425 [Candidatus Neomarinimicrobiota bacterium]